MSFLELITMLLSLIIPIALPIVCFWIWDIKL